jgi:DNA-binding NtrC family response regulator
MSNLRKLLLVEDEANLAKVLKVELERGSWTVQHASTGEEAMVYLEERFDVMLLDMNLPGMSGMDVFRSMSKGMDAPEVVVLTGNADIEGAVEAMKMGAYDYLQKPAFMERLFLILERAAEKSQLRLRNLLLEDQSRMEYESMSDIVISDPITVEVYQMAQKVSVTETSVLLTGDTGTGKDVLANFIHRNSPRSEGPFVSVNCASFQATVLENELFGHEKGAFTDARERKLGFFETATGGTIFLDEISEMPVEMQAKLLHVLEKGSFYRVGGTRIIQSDARVITATNRDITERVKEGRFREDLYYRINMFSIHLPTLSDRPEDIVPLGELFLKQANSPVEFSRESLAALKGYSWPGNVRELKNVVQRAVILADGEPLIEPEHLMLSGSISAGSPSTGAGSQDGKELLSLETLEERHISRVLESVGGKRKEAAEILGVDPKTLYRKIQRYGL